MRNPLPMPWPRQWHLSGETLAPGRLQPASGADPAFTEALARINALLDGKGETLPVAFEIADPRPATPRLGDDESYSLEIAAAGLRIRAPRLWGAQHALATLMQIAFSDESPEGSPAQQGPWRLPLGRIEDAPRFPWRGLMLDVARHFIRVEALLQTLDLMAFYKLNVLHLHLSDDQGFRFPSAAYPKLASRESYRAAELRELVAQAAARGIRVVPELDMPGHVASWLAAYPDWGPQRQPVAASRQFGAHQAVLNPADPAVYQAVDALFGELADIFPDPFIHIGGDEVQPDWWQESEAIAACMARHGLDGPGALQAHFNQKVAALAARRGKRLIGWDEVLAEGAPAGMVVQAWRGATARDRALAAGHDCIVSSGYYLDLCYPADLHHSWDLGAPEAQLLAQENALLEDPRLAHVAEGIRQMHAWREIAGPKRAAAPLAEGTSAAAARPEAATGSGLAPRSGDWPAGGARARAAQRTQGALLGGEACLWTELVDEQLLPVRLWSRMPAIAERFWSVEAPTVTGDAPANQPSAGQGHQYHMRKLKVTSGAPANQPSAVLAGQPARHPDPQAPSPAASSATPNMRLQASLERLAELGLLSVQEISRRLLRQFGVAESQLPVVELLEPIKWYGRLLGPEALRARIEGREAPQQRRYRADTPLNRPVDALLPESFAARRFAALLNGAPAALRQECRRLLAICRADGFLPELQGPVGQIAALLETVLAVQDRRLEPAAAIEQAAAAAQPQGEYIAALAPDLRNWLGRYLCQ